MIPQPLINTIVEVCDKDRRVIGTGFLIGPASVFTCAHVVNAVLNKPDISQPKPTDPVYIKFPNHVPAHYYTAHVAIWKPVDMDWSVANADIAGLTISGPPSDVTCIVLSTETDLAGHPFSVSGFHMGANLASGVIKGTMPGQLIQLTTDGLPIEQGYSGAPVWDEQLADFVGMIVSRREVNGAQVARIIPVHSLIEAWPEIPTFFKPRNPYKGLNAFARNDTQDFFGRTKLIASLNSSIDESLKERLHKTAEARLLAIIGASGSGKSSVMMAGLLPKLQEDHKSDNWIFLPTIRLGSRPIDAIATVFQQLLPQEGREDILTDLQSGPDTKLHDLALRLINDQPHQEQRCVVITIDQFEELFTLVKEEEDRERFINLLVKAITDPGGPVFVILTLRADLYDRPMRYRNLSQLIDQHNKTVLAMDDGELREAIERPAALPDVRLRFEARLVDALLTDLGKQSFSLPLLQFALQQLYDACKDRPDRLLTLEAYQKIGRISGALSEHAEFVYKALPSDSHRELARFVFLKLIHFDSTETTVTLRRLKRTELQTQNGAQTLIINEVIDAFIGAFLLTADQKDGEPAVEISHHALIEAWTTLNSWVRSNNVLLGQADEWKPKAEL